MHPPLTIFGNFAITSPVFRGVTQPFGALVTFSGRGPLGFKITFFACGARNSGAPSPYAPATPSLRHCLFWTPDMPGHYFYRPLMDSITGPRAAQSRPQKLACPGFNLVSGRLCWLVGLLHIPWCTVAIKLLSLLYYNHVNQPINQSIYLVTWKQHSMTEITKTDKIAKRYMAPRQIKSALTNAQVKKHKYK